MAATKSTPTRANRKAPAGRPAASRKKPDQEPRREVLGTLFIVVTVIIILIAIVFHPTEYSIGYSVYRLITGLFGNMIWVLALATAASAYLSFRSGDDSPTLGKCCLMVFVLAFLLLTAIEVFYIRDIAENMNYTGYVNFLSYSYRAHTGSGLMGALLAWPLYSLFSEIGAILVVLMLALLALVGMRAFSIRALGSRLSSRIDSYKAARNERRYEDESRTEEEEKPRTAKHIPSKKAAYALEKTAHEKSYRVRNAARSRSASKTDDIFTVRPSYRRKPGEGLYNERMDDDYVDTTAPIRLPNLKKGERRITPVKSASKEFEIPEIEPSVQSTYYGEEYKPASTRPSKKGSKAAKPVKKAPVIEQIDLMTAVREEDPEVRNKKYVKNALKKHDRKAKPVLTYSLDDTEYAKKTAAKKNAAKKEDPEIMPEIKLPNILNEEDFPARSAKPAGNKPAEKPAIVSEPAAPVKKAAPAPKPSFFEDEPVPETKKESPKGPAPFKPTSGITQTENSGEYSFPPIDLMEAAEEPKRNESGYDPQDMQRAEILVNTFKNFSIPVKITGISHGPAVTRFELLPSPGIKVGRLASYTDDIAMNLAAVSVRIEAPIPGKSAVGIEVPNVKKEIVRLRNVLESKEAKNASSRLTVALGKDNSGKYILADLASMPHVLIAGQTGSGKSVCINTIIISILYRATPDEVRMILIDPKMVELNAYNTIPHLLVPVVTDPKKAASVLEWAVSEMTRRYKEFAAHGARNIQSYNQKLPPDEKKMPQIVLIVDELADLMMTAPRDVEEAINRLAQLARAAGIHLVIATQRPSVDIITGVIKANIPTRIAFTVASGVDSRTILDSYGAEKLLGKGDMLYLPSDRNKPLRVQGAWVSEAEVQAVVDYISQTESTNFDEDILEHMENAVLSDAEKHDKTKNDEENTVDELFQIAVKCVIDAGQASISMLQRKLRVGYARAGRLIDEMAARGIVSQSEGSKSREVLLTREQYQELFPDDTLNNV